MTTHRCRFRALGHTGPADAPLVVFRCEHEGCGAQRKQPASTEMAALLAADWDRLVRTHGTWAEFRTAFMAQDNHGDGPFKLVGFELMEAIEKWAKGRPDVRIVGCDDGMFSGSMLVLVEHCTDDSYMGTSLVYVPQLSGPPSVAFLYPGHRRDLVAALGAVGEAAEPRTAAQQDRREAVQAVWQSEVYRGDA